MTPDTQSERNAVFVINVKCHDDILLHTCCSVNRGMKIEDFKFIYWMEYAHRMWGRALGIIFVLPYSYFLHKGYITLRLGLRLSALFALGAGQGLIGWWMVKSGLEVGTQINKLLCLFQ